MKSLTGKFSSARGWALLLALLLGAGMMISACGEEEVPAPTAPAPPPPPPPAPTPEPTGPATPSGLRASVGDGYIEWTWDAVAGALVYEGQFSEDATFTETDQTFLIAAPQTSHRVQNQTSGYFRVRSGAGASLTELQFSDWSDAVSAEPEATGPAIPTGLSASAGDGYIEWTWNAVANVLGYEGQFSMDATFDDADTKFLIRAPATSHRIHNQTSGYFRVRSGVGTSFTDLQYSDWSEAVRGTTDPPAPVPLSAPGNVQTGSPRNTTITVSWDEVDDADVYEVQQQVDGGAWSSASCGGAGNRVAVTECVASGLDSGTPHGFRVRAVPAASATGSAPSAWSAAATATTTGRAAVTLDDGGLNVRWRSEGEDQPENRQQATARTPQITWTWDPVDDRVLYPLIDHYVALLYPHNDYDDCPDLGASPLDDPPSTVRDRVDTGDPTDNTDAGIYNRWHDLDADISFTLTVADGVDTLEPDADADGTARDLMGEVRGLCVVRTWEDERRIRQFGEVSVVWGSTPPWSADATTNPERRDNVSRAVTVAVAWNYQIDEGFTYPLRLLTTDRETGEPAADPADCADGTPVLSPSAVGRQNYGLFHTETNPTPYTHYQLCTRAETDYGASEWTFVGSHAGTRPAPPSVPALQLGQSNVVQATDRRQTVHKLFWSVPHKAGTPLDGDEHDIVAFRSTENQIPRGDPEQTTCQAAYDLGGDAAGTQTILLATDYKFARSDNAATGIDTFNSNNGFDFDLDPAAVAAPIVSNTGSEGGDLLFDEYFMYVCVRGDGTDGTGYDSGPGPWTISRTPGYVGGDLPAAHRAPADPGLVATLGSAIVNNQAQFTASWTAPAGIAATQYQLQYLAGPTAGGTVAVANLVAGLPIQTTAANDLDYVFVHGFGNPPAEVSGVFRVRYLRNVRGIVLMSGWTASAVQPQAP